jgi:hypothetical protein
MKALRSAVAGMLALGLLTTGATNAHGLTQPSAIVSITQVSGYAGHAFVYAQVTTSATRYPAPTGSGHLSPYFSEWISQPFSAPSCPWVWAVYVFDRATNTQLNALPLVVAPNFGTSTVVCASPTGTPVDQPPQSNAAAQLDLDLGVGVAPAQPVAGATSVVSASLSSSLTRDLNLYLSMAIQDWSVTRWTVDFGDAQSTSMPGLVQSRIDMPHVYRAAGPYRVSVLAAISGHAQAAVYDHFGAVHLITRSFAVEVGNTALTTVRRPPPRAYLSPQAVVGVSPTLGSIPSGAAAFRHVDVLRGAPTAFAVRLIVLREGLSLVDGVVNGLGKSTLIAWRYDGAMTYAAARTSPGAIRTPDQPLRLQWNAPDRLAGSQPQDYVVPVTILVQTRYPDGHVAKYVVATSFTVSVDFAAESG